MPRTEPQKHSKILIIGGYGNVGQRVAKQLAPLFPNRVVVAGRSRTRANTAATTIGCGAAGRMIDVMTAEAVSALDDVGLVLVCVDQTDTRFVRMCLSRGIHYVDICADYDFLARVEKLDDLAKRHNATALLSVGVAPGLSNLLAALAKKGMERTDQIDIALELGLGDRHGKAAVEWILDNVDSSFDVLDHGQRKTVRSLRDSIEIGLPGQAPRRAYRFNFSDQHVVPRTLGVPTASTWLRLDNRFATWLIAATSRVGLGRLLRGWPGRKLAVWFFMNIHLGSDTCGVAARATGLTKQGRESLTFGLAGRQGALMTAVVAAESVRQLVSGNPNVGVLHGEQLLAIEPVVKALRREVPELIVDL